MDKASEESEVGLDGLTACLLRGVVEHTGSSIGYLFLNRQEHLYLCAHALHDGTVHDEACLLEEVPELPLELLRLCWTDSCFRGHQRHGALWPTDREEPDGWLIVPLCLFNKPLGLLYLVGEKTACLSPGDVGTYMEMAIQRVTRTRETEALERDRARLEELVEERTRKLEEAQKELVRQERLATLGQLIATVSHELRNPLGTVRGSVFLIANKLLGKDLGVERALDRAERNIVRCDRIIEDLLAYTRTHDLELEPVRIDRWLDNTLEEYPFPHDVTVRVRLRSRAMMDIEPERLRRCLINLINNACDAMKAGSSDEEDGSKRLTVASRFNEEKQQLEIAVADSGPGIPADEIGKIMEPLFSTKSFGVGLGLPTVQQIMEQHNGGLSIKSVVGQGTIMTLWIPFGPHDKREEE